MRRAPVTMLSRRLWLTLLAMTLMLLLIGVLGLIVVYRSLDRVPRGAKLVTSELVEYWGARLPVPVHAVLSLPGSGARSPVSQPGGGAVGGVSNEARWERLSTGSAGRCNVG